MMSSSPRANLHSEHLDRSQTLFLPEATWPGWNTPITHLHTAHGAKQDSGLGVSDPLSSTEQSVNGKKKTKQFTGLMVQPQDALAPSSLVGQSGVCQESGLFIHT